MEPVRDPLGPGSCGLSLALEIVGERWAFLLLRAALNGLTHFEEFLAIGIARNILSSRLAKLVEHGILVRQQQDDDRRKVTYKLTRKGIDLVPAMLALREWGDRYELGGPSDPVLVDRRDRRPIGPFTVRAHDGRELGYHDLAWARRAEIDAQAEAAALSAPAEPPAKPDPTAA